jgi:hypothetical protein
MRSTVGKDSWFYCEARVSAQICGKCSRSTVGQEPALQRGARDSDVLWNLIPLSTAEHMSALYCGQVSGLYCGVCVRALLWGKCPRSTVRNW